MTMIFIIAGASHTGKTCLAQRLLEKYKFPYLSVDHLKMGLIRSGNLTATVDEDEKLTSLLWPIVREIIKTAMENRQNLIVEGCYIPFDWKKDFSGTDLEDIRYLCLIMSESYIRTSFDQISGFANAIEARLMDDYTKSEALKDNARILDLARKYELPYFLIDQQYPDTKSMMEMFEVPEGIDH